MTGQGIVYCRSIALASSTVDDHRLVSGQERMSRLPREQHLDKHLQAGTAQLTLTEDCNPCRQAHHLTRTAQHRTRGAGDSARAPTGVN